MQNGYNSFLEMLRQEIGESVSDRRRKKGIKQQELAAMCGISPRMLRLVESGGQRYGLDTYLLISEALGIAPEALLAEAISRIRQTADGRERLARARKIVYERMQQRLGGYRQEKAKQLTAARRAEESQDAITKANYQPKGLARGGKRAKIYVSMI